MTTPSNNGFAYWHTGGTILLPGVRGKAAAGTGNFNYWHTGGTVAYPDMFQGGIKVWTGSAWVRKPTKVWTGSAWVAKPLFYWNGSQWVIV